MDNARVVIAKSINCSPNEIIFTSSGSEANNLALAFAIFVLIDPTSHASVINRIYNWKLDVDDKGKISLESLSSNLNYTKILKLNPIVSICGANNEIGTIQPIKEISKICHENDALLHVDAVQLFPNQKIDVKDLGIDLMSVTGSKIGCPSGIGFLYVKNGIPTAPIIAGEQENGIRGGTENVPYILGLSEAVKLIDYSKIDHIKSLRDYFTNKLLKLPNTYLVGESGDNRLANNINICFKGIEASSLLYYLDLYEIYASGESACNSKNLEPSHVLKAIHLNENDLHSCVRFTIGEYTTIDELEYAFKIIERFVTRQNQYSGGVAI